MKSIKYKFESDYYNCCSHVIYSNITLEVIDRVDYVVRRRISDLTWRDLRLNVYVSISALLN